MDEVLLVAIWIMTRINKPNWTFSTFNFSLSTVDIHIN